MKKWFFLLLICSFLLYGGSFAQIDCPWEIIYRYDFDGDDLHSVEIDTSNSENIWQIGSPQKAILNSAVTPPNALITDTINPYQDYNKSTFIIRVNKPTEAPDDFCWSYMDISILHRFNTDTLYSGGYIEISYDGGKNWTNIIYDNYANVITETNGYMYSVNDTILGGINAFTGNNTADEEYNYEDAQFRWMRNYPESMEVDSCMLRFTFISDKNTGNYEGWMLDDIFVTVVDFCHSSINELLVHNYQLKFRRKISLKK